MRRVIDYKLIAYEEEAKRGEKAQLAKVLTAVQTGSIYFICIWSRRWINE